jgi:hypothetical protein
VQAINRPSNRCASGSDDKPRRCRSLVLCAFRVYNRFCMP